MERDIIMDYTLIQNADKEMIYYGVYNTQAEIADQGDVLCTVRKNYFESSGKKQKNRSTFNIMGDMIRTAYTMEAGKPLKWKKLIGSRIAQRVTIKDNCYIVESLDSDRRVFKKSCFDYSHQWVSTEYYLSGEKNIPDCTYVPSYDGDKPILIIKTVNNNTELLYPFEMTLDKELTEKLNALVGEPPVLCRTSCGTFYFCTKEESEKRRTAAENLLNEKEDEPVSDDELIEPGFEINVNAALDDEEKSDEINAVTPKISVEIIPGLPEEPEDYYNAENNKPDSDNKTSIMLPEKAEKHEDDVVKEKTGITEEKEDEIPEEPAPAISDIKETDSGITIREFTFTADQPQLYEESSTGQEAGIVAEDGENCVFAGQCPYENMDKLIIESGGRQYFYFGETSGDSRHGSGRTAMFDGKTAYEGGYKDDKRNGFGVYYYKSGKLCYVGNWSDNKREGLGTAFSSSDGSVFVGKWHDNEPVSVGASFDREGELVYVGKTKDGKRSGTGITYSAGQGTFFVGKYKDGEFLGKGTLFDSDGNMIYSGGYEGGMCNGEGVSYNKDGSVKYKGSWKNDICDGKGTLYLEDGCILKGSFRNGKADGICTLTDASGKMIYTGGYSNDLYNGAGRLYSDNGGYAEGRFADGEPTGIFNEYSPSGELLYCGEWTDMQRNGRGVEYKKGEKLYEGDFSGGLYHGTGKLYDKGELVYSGSFKDGNICGFGTETDCGETVYVGMWENGSYSGSGILYEDGHPKYAGSFSDGRREGRINEIKDGKIIRQCIYENDEMVYMCEYDENGSIVYYGNVKDGLRSGMGCSFRESGEKEFEGIFRSGRPEKAMSVFYKDLKDLPPCSELDGSDYIQFIHAPECALELYHEGGVYSGQVKNNIPDGRGTKLYFDHRYTGMFAGGKPCGHGVIYMRDGSEIEGEFYPEPTEMTETLKFTNLNYYLKKQ